MAQIHSIQPHTLIKALKCLSLLIWSPFQKKKKSSGVWISWKKIITLTVTNLPHNRNNLSSNFWLGVLKNLFPLNTPKVVVSFWGNLQNPCAVFKTRKRKNRALSSVLKWNTQNFHKEKKTKTKYFSYMQRERRPLPTVALSVPYVSVNL